MIKEKEYHITSLRKDLISFGRSALVDNAFSLNEDAKRRDFRSEEHTSELQSHS